MKPRLVMSVKPLLYDVFCGAGGATKGYQMAGFRVIGIDIAPQPHYCGDGFIQMDAFEFFDRYEQGEFERAAAFAVSPPCQGYSIMRNLPWLKDREYPMLIDATRKRLEAVGKPWVIENVMGAKLPAGWLCGQMFGRPFYRHRYFETNWFWMQPGHPAHTATIKKGRMLGGRASTPVTGEAVKVSGQTAYFNGAQKRGVGLGHAAGIDLFREAMQIDWMTRDEITEALPPCYTEYIGRFLMAHLGATLSPKTEGGTP